MTLSYRFFRRAVIVFLASVWAQSGWAATVTITSPQQNDKVRGLVEVTGTFSGGSGTDATLTLYVNNVVEDSIVVPVADGTFVLRLDSNDDCLVDPANLKVYWSEENTWSNEVGVKECSLDLCCGGSIEATPEVPGECETIGVDGDAAVSCGSGGCVSGAITGGVTCCAGVINDAGLNTFSSDGINPVVTGFRYVGSETYTGPLGKYWTHSQDYKLTRSMQTSTKEFVSIRRGLTRRLGFTWNNARPYTLDAWGNQLNAAQPTTNPYRYVGKENYYTDGQSGLMLLGARYYGSSSGAFLTLDPNRARLNWQVKS